MTSPVPAKLKEKEIPQPTSKLENEYPPLSSTTARSETSKMSLTRPKEWYLKRAQDFKEIGSYKKAVEMYDAVTRLDPDNQPAWFYKGYCLEKIGRDGEAVEAYEEAINLNPRDSVAWMNKGISLMNLERYQEAVEALDIYLNMKPEDALILG